MKKFDRLDKILTDNIVSKRSFLNVIAIYYFAKGFVEECNNLDIYKCKKIKVKHILRYLRYGKILIKIFGSLNKVEEFVDNIDEYRFYKFYYDLGREYFKEFYFINIGY